MNPKAERYSSKVLKHDMFTLTVYKCKPNKNIMLLSSLHQSVGVASDAKKMPETVAFYNSTKYVVDVADQMARKYSVKASPHRWPVQVFFKHSGTCSHQCLDPVQEEDRNLYHMQAFYPEVGQRVEQTICTGTSREHAICHKTGGPGGRHASSMNKTPEMPGWHTCSVCKEAVGGACNAQALTRYICAECENHGSDDNNAPAAVERCNWRVTLQFNTARIVRHTSVDRFFVCL